jgi:hypothetical protein
MWCAAGLRNDAAGQVLEMPAEARASKKIAPRHVSSCQRGLLFEIHCAGLSRMGLCGLI